MPFPSNPTNGQTTTINGVIFTWNSTKGAWVRAVTEITGGGNVTIAGNLIPNANLAYDLGTDVYRFRSLYLSGNTIDLAGATIKTDVTTGAIALVPQATPANPNPTGIVISPLGAISTVTTIGGNVQASDIATASNTSATTGTSSSNLSVVGTANLGNIITTGGIFWANGTSALVASYGNTQVAEYLQSSSTITDLVANVTAANSAVQTLSANIGNLVAGAPGALDTLYEIANSLGNNASLSTTLLNTIAGVQANVTAANTNIATAVSASNATFTGTTTVANLVTTNGIFWANGSSYSSGGGGGGSTGGTISMSMPNALSSPFVGTFRFYPTKTVTLQTVYANLGGAPTGGNLGFAILKNGSNIGYAFTITSSNLNMTPVDVSAGAISLTTNDYLTLNLTNSGVSASDLSVRITYT